VHYFVNSTLQSKTLVLAKLDLTQCISRWYGSSLYMKVIGSRSQSHEQKNVKCYPATPMFKWEHGYNWWDGKPWEIWCIISVPDHTRQRSITFSYMRSFDFEFVGVNVSYNLTVAVQCKLIRGWSCLRLEGNPVFVMHLCWSVWMMVCCISLL